jgi:hypothetical protein
MARKPIPSELQATVLLKARRRCCICFGLNRDTLIKQGQLAHLDGDAANNDEDNLAFICFDHHDQYDSRTQQSKNFTVEEVKRLRNELHRAIRLAFATEVSFGEAKALGPDLISGHYIRSGDFESAEIKIQRMPDGRYHVSGLALWGMTRERGPNLGDLDFVAELHGDVIEYRSLCPNDKTYRAVLRFSAESLKLTEENWSGMFGMNVNFSGDYAKAE